MQNFNLIDSPWIPVRWRHDSCGDTPALVSLHTAFSSGKEIADLDCAPHERIALIRLLVCITHASLGAPEDEDEWDDFGQNFAQEITSYLQKPEIYPHFNLLGDGPRFLQEEVPIEGDPVPTSKLIPNLATGNNPTLLDHSGIDSNRSFPISSICLALLTFQNFYPLYGAGYKGRGPCSDRNATHTLIYAETLKDTVSLNLLDMKTIQSFSPNGLGKPIWECPNEESLELSTQTYLGRLVPRHRSLKLTNDLNGFYHQNHSLQYIGWEPYREASTTVVVNKKGERILLSARLDRAIWRDLHSITALHTKAKLNAAPTLRSHESQLADGIANIWTGALVTDLKAKILDTVESTFTVPHQLFCEDGQRIYASGVDHADTISKKLFSKKPPGAIKTYWSALEHANPPIDTAQKHFWHRLDQQHRMLINMAGDPESRRGLPAFGAEGAKDPWTVIVRDAAHDAFDSVCPRGTPRQIQAYATGIKPLLRALYPKELKKKDKTTNSTTASTASQSTQSEP